MRKQNGERVKSISGAAKLRKAGRRGILIGVHQADYEILWAGARREMRTLSGFIRYHALRAASIPSNDHDGEEVTA